MSSRKRKSDGLDDKTVKAPAAAAAATAASPVAAAATAAASACTSGHGQCRPLLPVDLKDISQAMCRIRNKIFKTPLLRAHSELCEATGMDLYLKKDFILESGSFKERGARNALMSLTEEQKRVGVIAASAGNHAMALALHGKDLGIPVTVVMPTLAPVTKSGRCERLGATVVSFGDHIGQSKEHAHVIATEKGLRYINGYDDKEIIAGAGTMGLEILEQIDDFDAIVVPVGGGGLIAGLSLAIKSVKPDVLVIGVEPKKAASFTAALAAGKPVTIEVQPTLADGLCVPCVGSTAFAVAKHHVDKVVCVDEAFIARAVLHAVEMEKSVVEGGGAAGLAACLDPELLPELKGKRVVVPLCGGNIDTTVLGRCLERGMACTGRLVRFKVTVPDRPGSISKLAELIASLGASIKDVFHERAWLSSDIFAVTVKCVCETRDVKHAEHLYAGLTERYGDNLLVYPSTGGPAVVPD